MTWYENNMLFPNSMSNVDESVDENDSLGEDPIVSNEPDKNDVEHNPFEFPHDDKIPCSKLLFDQTVWQVEGFDNGDENLNMPLLANNVQMCDAPSPQAVHAQMAPSQSMPM